MYKRKEVPPDANCVVGPLLGPRGASARALWRGLCSGPLLLLWPLHAVATYCKGTTCGAVGQQPPSRRLLVGLRCHHVRNSAFTFISIQRRVGFFFLMQLPLPGEDHNRRTPVAGRTFDRELHELHPFHPSTHLPLRPDLPRLPRCGCCAFSSPPGVSAFSSSPRFRMFSAHWPRLSVTPGPRT